MKFKILMAISTLTLLGCGGGSNSSESSEEVLRLEPGAFDTTLQYEDGTTREAFTLLSPTGKFAIVLLNFDDVTVGNISFAAPDILSGRGLNVFFESSNQLFNSYQSVQGELNGTVSSAGQATVDVTATAGDDLAATLVRFNEFSDSGVQMSQVSGTYTKTKNEITTSFTIASDGTLTGSDSTGCVWNGVVTIPDPQYNALEIDFTAANCGETFNASASQRNGDYSTLADYTESLNRLSVYGTNGDVVLIINGIK